MFNFNTLWNVWLLLYFIIINLYLIYNSIADYLHFKLLAFDPAYGGNWDLNVSYVILGSLIISMAILPFILYFHLTKNGNISDDGLIIGENLNTLRFILNESGPVIMPIDYKNSNKKKSNNFYRFFKLISMELPPISYFLHLFSALCYLVPKPFIDAAFIKHKVINPNNLWHTDLDQIFMPDQQHFEFTYNHLWDFVQPVSPAYFNLFITLLALSLRYSSCFWRTSRTFTLLLSTMILSCSIVILLDNALLSLLIKFVSNEELLTEPLKINVSPMVFLFLSIIGNILQVLSFTTVFHYGLLQYADAIIAKSRKLRRIQHRQQQQHPQQVLVTNNGPNNTITNNSSVGFPSVFTNDNHYSDNNNNNNNHNNNPTIQKVSSDGSTSTTASKYAKFSKSFNVNICAIVLMLLIVVLKSFNIYIAFTSFYQFFKDKLTLTTFIVSVLYLIFWFFVWFAFTLRRSWKFHAPVSNESNVASELVQLPNGQAYPMIITTNPHANMVHQQLTNDGSQIIMVPAMQNSFIMSNKASDLNLNGTGSITGIPGGAGGGGSGVNIRNSLNNNNFSMGLDGMSDETDMSSRISSSNYVLLQSMRNGQQINGVNNNYDGHNSLLRTPIYLSYSASNANGGMNNPHNIIYANDDSMQQQLSYQQQLQQHHHQQQQQQQMRNSQIGETVSSEHSFNSNRVNSPFESMPPTLPNFDENRYKQLNTNNANALAIDKLIPRYLRNPSLDGSITPLIAFPNDLMMSPTPTMGTMINDNVSCASSTNQYNQSRYRQRNVTNNKPTYTNNNDKYSTVDGSAMNRFYGYEASISPQHQRPTSQDTDCMLGINPRLNNINNNNNIKGLNNDIVSVLHECNDDDAEADDAVNNNNNDRNSNDDDHNKDDDNLGVEMQRRQEVDEDEEERTKLTESSSLLNNPIDSANQNLSNGNHGVILDSVNGDNKKDTNNVNNKKMCSQV